MAAASSATAQVAEIERTARRVPAAEWCGGTGHARIKIEAEGG